MAHVLIVDDEKSIRITLGEFLAGDGHTVFTAPDVEQALAVLVREPIDIVATDIILPRINGLQLLHRLRAQNPAVQVIMMTGEPTLDTVTETMRNGAIDYLVKPISKAAILRAVTNAARVKVLNDDKRRLEDANCQYREHLERLVRERTSSLAATNRQLLQEIDARQQTEEMLRATNEKLHHAFDGIVNALAATSEWRDPYTAGHQRRVAGLATAIAREMGVTEDETAKIRIAALLHDIGKIAVPIDILAKPIKLSEPEFAIVKVHPEVGYEILHAIEFEWPIAEIVLQSPRLSGWFRLSGSHRSVSNPLRKRAFSPWPMWSNRCPRIVLIVPHTALDATLASVTAGAGTRYDTDVVAACVCLLLRSPGML